MGRDPGAPDDKGNNKDLPPPDEILVTTGPSDNISGDCLNLDDSVLKEEWRDRLGELGELEESDWEVGIQQLLAYHRASARRWELHQEVFRWEKLRKKLRREKLREKLRWRELRREKLHWRELHLEELRERLPSGKSFPEERQEELREELRGVLRWRELRQEELRQEELRREKLRSECFVQGTSSAMGKGIVERLLHQGLDMCMTCKREFPFCSCQHKLMPITAKAKWNASSEGTITMHNPGYSDEFNGFTRENGDIKTGPGLTIHSPVTMPNMSDEIKSEPSQASDSFSSHGFAGNDSGIEMVLGHTPCHPAPIATVPNVSDETTSDSSSSHDFAPIDIESGRTYSSDFVPSEPRLRDVCSYHHTYECNWQRLATVVDPLLAVIVQIGCSLLAFKTSDSSSPTKDVLFYLLVFICMLGFLYTLASKWFHCAKMAVIGLVATALGFLMTMALVVMYKIR